MQNLTAPDERLKIFLSKICSYTSMIYCEAIFKNLSQCDKYQTIIVSLITQAPKGIIFCRTCTNRRRI